MKRLLDLILMTLGGWIGWIAGAWISLFVAFIAAVIGTGAGLYLARQLHRQLLP